MIFILFINTEFSALFFIVCYEKNSEKFELNQMIFVFSFSCSDKSNKNGISCERMMKKRTGKKGFIFLHPLSTHL